jgi:hypothetical protein
MADLARFNSTIARFAKVADFLTIYIDEAHASDGWRFRRNPYNIRQHRTLKERCAAAQILADTDLACPVVVDSMSSEADRKYGGSSERLYIVLDGVVVYAGKMGPMGYHVQEVTDWLQQHHGDID